MTENILYNQEVETLDSTYRGAVTLLQPRKGYRFSVDALLLADFASPTRSGAAVDLGCGCGIIGLCLLHQGKVKRVTGIEIQGNLARLAERNVQINGFERGFQVMCADFRAEMSRFGAQSLDLVIANPPFFKKNTGRENPNPQERIARREQHGGMKDYLIFAKTVLKGQGKAVMIYPSERLFELFACASDAGFSARRLRLVHGRHGEKARLALVELVTRPNTALGVEPPLYLESSPNIPSEEAERIYSGR